MSDKIFGFLKKLKEPKYLIGIGIMGIVLIMFSNVFQGQTKKENTVYDENFDYDKYLKTVKSNVEDIVYGITGDNKSTVVITLENSIKYSYADDKVNDTNSSLGEKTNQSSTKTESSHITVQTSSGDERALIVTTNMPEIRGVAIICELGDDEVICEKITSAVIAALNITSKHVYVSGKN